jgi:hypothetical protein
VINMWELLGWDVGMSAMAAILLVVGALLLGAIPQFIGDATIGFEWVFTAAAILIGGWLGSEAFGAASTWGLEFEGLYVLPAIIGGVVLGLVVDALVRYLSGGSYTHHARPV